MTDQQWLFNEYRNTQGQINHLLNSAQQIESNKQVLWLTLWEQIFPWLAKIFFPRNTANIEQRQELNNNAWATHLNLIERETKAAQIWYQLPTLFTRTPDQVQHIEQILTTIDQLIPDLIAQIKIIQQILSEAKSKIKRGMVVEVADLVIETNRFPGKQLVSSLTDILSTRMSTQWLDTDEINAQLTSLTTFEEKLISLQQQLKQLGIEQTTNTHSTKPLTTLPNLSVVEYADLLSDMLHKGKDIGSIASLFAQGYTYLSVDDLTEKLTELQRNLRNIQQDSIQLRNDIEKYREFDAAYMPPATP